jgi:hypothetical protein
MRKSPRDEAIDGASHRRQGVSDYGKELYALIIYAKWGQGKRAALSDRAVYISNDREVLAEAWFYEPGDRRPGGETQGTRELSCARPPSRPRPQACTK